MNAKPDNIDKSRLIFNKLGSKFGEIFSKNDTNTNSAGYPCVRNHILQGFFRNFFTKDYDDASKISTKNSASDTLGLSELGHKLEN